MYIFIHTYVYLCTFYMLYNIIRDYMHIMYMFQDYKSSTCAGHCNQR